MADDAAPTPPTTAPPPTAPLPTAPLGAAAKDAMRKDKKKPGNRGDFHGMREEYLLAHLDGYFDASKRGKTREFWPGLFTRYMERFDWRLPLSEEPGKPLPAEGPMTPDLLEQKTRALLDIKKKIKTWYNHRL
ncbi:hypothetical protein C8R43DRAFT_1140576 [Mycena crocata]|nr:hypothetical protein C8R43DRAFT_1140576 [Mycena crocata]